MAKGNNVSSSQDLCETPLFLSRVAEPGDALRILKATHCRENVFIFHTKETPLLVLHCHGFPAPQDDKKLHFPCSS